MRVTIDEKKEEEKDIVPISKDEPESLPVDEQSKMLCNVIVRATHELHVNQHKSRNEIQIFLRNDCQQLSTKQLIDKVSHTPSHTLAHLHVHLVRRPRPTSWS